MRFFSIMSRIPSLYFSKVKSVSVALGAVLGGAQDTFALLDYTPRRASVSHVRNYGIKGVGRPLFTQRRIGIKEKELVACWALWMRRNTGK